MRRPLDSYTSITTRHGEPVLGSTYGKHLGTDYAVALNTPVKAPVAGKIATQGWSDSVGNYIEIDGVDGRRHRVLHLNARQIANGAQVSEGQQIGLSGSTGSTSTGPHVHWDARKGGTGFGDGFANFVDTEKLAQEGVTPPSSQWNVGDKAWLRATEWRIYKPGVKPVVGNEFQKIRPNDYHEGPNGQIGVIYTILGATPYANTFLIQTQMYGQAWIYLDKDATKV